jgi:Na+/melibiose symporter-like transporter
MTSIRYYLTFLGIMLALIGFLVAMFGSGQHDRGVALTGAVTLIVGFIFCIFGK